jgi:hypothetical protein
LRVCYSRIVDRGSSGERPHSSKTLFANKPGGTKSNTVVTTQTGLIRRLSGSFMHA